MTNTDAKIMREAGNMVDPEVGDRVALVRNPGWNLPYRKFAEEGRWATIKRIADCGLDRYLIAFDVKRKGSTPHTLYCGREDFVIVEPHP